MSVYLSILSYAVVSCVWPLRSKNSNLAYPRQCSQVSGRKSDTAALMDKALFKAYRHLGLIVIHPSTLSYITCANMLTRQNSDILKCRSK